MALRPAKLVCRVLLMMDFLPDTRNDGGELTLTGMRTSDRLRLFGGRHDANLDCTHKNESESGLEKPKHKMNKTCSPTCYASPLGFGGRVHEQSTKVPAWASLWCDACIGCRVCRLRAATGHRLAHRLHKGDIPSAHEGNIAFFPPACLSVSGLRLISSGRLSR
jgi:hypothetical protein